MEKEENAEGFRRMELQKKMIKNTGCFCKENVNFWTDMIVCYKHMRNYFTPAKLWPGWNTASDHFDWTSYIKRNPPFSKANFQFLNSLLMTLYCLWTCSFSRSKDIYLIHTAISFKQTNRWTLISNLIRILLQITGDGGFATLCQGQRPHCNL